MRIQQGFLVCGEPMQVSLRGEPMALACQERGKLPK
jgi:hypothetical protein